MKKLLVLLLLLCLMPGCRLVDWWRNGKPSVEIPPMNPTPAPTLESITWTINKNTSAIRSMKAETATLYVPGAPVALRSQLYFERPRRLRLQGRAMSLSGRDLDFGSNDHVFWLWTRQAPKEIYYCRHDQFPDCPLRSVFPIEPEWIIEALGMVEFRSEEQHSGPHPEDDGNWRIVTQRQTAVGQFTKHTVIDAKMGWVVRQELYSPQNDRVALAIMSQHDYDKETGIYFARRIEIQCQGTEGSLTIDLGKPTFNMSTPLSTSTFEMPQYDGCQAVDLCGPEIRYGGGAVAPAPGGTWQAPAAAPPAGSAPPAVRYMELNPQPMTMQSPFREAIPAGPDNSEASIRTTVR